MQHCNMDARRGLQLAGKEDEKADPIGSACPVEMLHRWAAAV